MRAARAGLARRLWAYQKERFPLAFMLPMSLAFSFSAVAYSRLASGRAGFIPAAAYAVGAFTALVTLFMLRVLDEHKDREIDARFRKELPVPRGLVSLAELRVLGASLSGAVLLLNVIFLPALLPMLALVALYAALMTKEFFVSRWLRRHLLTYLWSHMLILPIIDVYTTALDWRLEGGQPAPSLAIFLAVTFMNGVVVEIGRKLRAPGMEKKGVDTYSKAWAWNAPPTPGWAACFSPPAWPRPPAAPQAWGPGASPSCWAWPWAASPSASSSCATVTANGPKPSRPSAACGP